MLRETTRPLRDAERAKLEQRARWSVNEDLGGAITFFAVLGVLGGALGSCVNKSVPNGLAITLVVAFVLWVVVARVNLRARIAEKNAYRRDLAKGETRVLDVEDAEVFVQKERSSEGPIYVLKVNESRVLVLIGQWLHGHERALRAKGFELTFAPVSRLVFAIRAVAPGGNKPTKLPVGAVAIEDLDELQLLDADHPAVRDAFTAPKSKRG